MNNTFPFTAIVGLELAKRSLLFHAVDPRLGGLLLMGHRGNARRLKRVLTNDPGLGIARYADAGYKSAKKFASCNKVNLPEK